ncbi:hypothetical protein [Piscirickettsia litoralis]|uniref:AsmA domain-containing protein n=1 Tax=Piscirickettsia litoralis TaxID=1891921 RepID=A0ABX3A813_9GAMM|nr:hypothetical protein [Piscirickettsia litoralis]ODN43778.1 hypothetical protein BGC07_13830 [Piscirickettsia litoralis]
MRRFIGTLLLVGLVALVATYWVARFEIPVLVQGELKKAQKAELSANLSSLSYSDIDAGFTFLINGSFQLHNVEIQLSDLPGVTLFAPTISVTGFEQGTVKGLQIDQLYIKKDKAEISNDSNVLADLSDWFFTIHYYQNLQDRQKKLDLNIYKKILCLLKLGCLYRLSNPSLLLCMIGTKLVEN